MADEQASTTSGKKRTSQNKPRPAYLAYKINGDEIEVVTVTRKADELLNIVTKDSSLKYTRFEIK